MKTRLKGVFMNLALLICACIIIICIVSNKISSKIGVPTLLLFLIVGMVFGSDGLFKIYFDNYDFAEKICSVTLIFIMFYGGFGTNWKMAKPVAVKAFLLASVGVVITAFVTGLFCYYILKFGFLESLLIGAVISSTDAASVFSIFRSRKLNLKGGLASLLELESGSNDPTAYMLTIIIIGFMTNKGVGSVPIMILAQVFLGLGIGALVACLAIFILKKTDISINGMDMVFVVAAALLAYAAAGLIGGNGYLSVYVFGIFLGNSKIRNKVQLVHFFDGITGLMQISLFFLLGLLSFPSQMVPILLPSIGIALFLTFVGRPVATFLILTPFRVPFKQQILVAWAGLRGAASIVFAIMVTVSDVTIKGDIFHIVFCVAILSVLFQGSLLPVLARKLDLVDDSEPVLKTFNDYIDEVNMELVQMHVGEGHSWIGKTVEEIDLPVNSLVIMIERGRDAIIPNGNTMVKKDDVVIFNCETYTSREQLALKEVIIKEKHQWAGKKIRDLNLKDGKLVMMIQRDQATLIPNGDTDILPGDIMILNKD